MPKFNWNSLRGMWRLTKVYWRSEEKWWAHCILALIIGLNLGDVYILVLLNEWNNKFYNAIQKYNRGTFFNALLEFTILATFFIIISVYEQYYQQKLEIRWRQWLTKHFLQDWLQNQSYYRLQLTSNNTDNPDQRISEDLRLFVSNSLNLSIGSLKAAVTLGSFIMILWRLSGPLTFRLGYSSIAIPGYMVWTAIGYAAAGTWLTSLIGRPLVKLNFEQQRYEADFRYSMVRLRENSESIAFYNGEKQEQTGLLNRFKKVFENFHSLMRRQKKLTWLTSGYSQIAIIFPFLVAAPRYFRHQIQLGGLIQIASAFGRVQDSLSFFISNYSTLAEWQAVIFRLAGFQSNIELITHESLINTMRITESQSPSLTVSGLQISLPNRDVLMDDLEFCLNPGDDLLISGPSGCGKSTLMRTLAGIWPFGKGRISWPQKGKVLFLPQKPYLPLGTLREALLYPQGTDWLSDELLEEIMILCKLGDYFNRLDDLENWSQLLSLGEQQRIAFARALMQNPQWLFLDEATSALDEPTEEIMYGLLHKKLKDTTIISVGHRQTLTRFHKLRLHINGTGKWFMQNLSGSFMDDAV